MSKSIIITGATGLIGDAIVHKLHSRGDEVTVFTRSPQKGKETFPFINNFVKWDYNKPDEWKNELEGKTAVIHLAGKNLMKQRWNDEHKKEAYNSRIDSSQALVEAMRNCVQKPEVFLSSSAIGYYGSSETEVTEESNPGNDFLARLCLDWENEAAKAAQFRIRHAAIRTANVLSTKDGALAKMMIPFKFFVGGTLGTGRQWFPWIHIDDMAELYLFALDNENVSGALNGGSPNPVRMDQFTDTVGDVMKRPSFFKVPKLALEAAFGEGAEFLTSGAKVIPKRTMEYGFEFKFPHLKPALEDLIK